MHNYVYVETPDPPPSTPREFENVLFWEIYFGKSISGEKYGIVLEWTGGTG